MLHGTVMTVGVAGTSNEKLGGTQSENWLAFGTQAEQVGSLEFGFR